MQTMQVCSAAISVSVLCALFVALEGASTDRYKFLVTPIIEECLKEVQATDADADAVINRVELKTPEAKCLLRCIYQKGGVMEGDSFVHHDEIKEVYAHVYSDQPEKVEKFPTNFAKCAETLDDTTRSNGCEMAAHILHCFIEFDHDLD